ncbi:6,7-dimethyl-8-ribityllumazine synthase [Methylobacterium sp. 77]|uniref:6,7-dimethyl-8-ribityllumazine synthase n=1 Tax=Methylobacterium sp. 77 TaxID=1101192 RepID=UPI0003609B37|nr:6,7-dimethyl-8-ribityllumazine synthase [Methylobacterium sp. 77]
MVSTPPAARSAAPANVKGARVLVVEARYYDDIADELLAGAQGALDAAEAEGVVVTVPGALEIPSAIAILVEEAARAGQPYDAAVALGCVIRGETGHYDIVAGESARALMDLSVMGRLPLGNGILTVETMEQALARARVSEMNKGAGAAEAALSVLALKRAAAAAPVGED